MAARRHAKNAPSEAVRPVSMADLARELGVSMTTISRALSDHHSIGPATKQAVLKLAKKLNYQPNHLAAALRKGKSKLLGVMVPYIEGRFFASVVHGIETAASKAGYSVIMCQSNEDVVQERKNLDNLLRAQVAGILVSVSRSTTDFHHFEKVRKHHVPLVFFDRILEGNDVNAVVLNDRAGAYQTTKHLLAQGCRRVAHLGGPLHMNIYKYRRQGYLDALQDHGIAPDESLMLYSNLTVETGREGMAQLLDLPEPPDAVFSAGDSAVLGALQLLKSRGLRVPEDVALAGFSNEALTTVTEPQLTSVDQRCEEMGQATFRLFTELVEAEGAAFSNRQVVLQPQLFVRASSLRSGVDDSPEISPQERELQKHRVLRRN
ncbi:MULTISPECIES: LacI family DNA-binding transcriptional regulator [Hymenobacter]|uniref:LacI family DNA-binding transcriptional regulator n=1 Tax=Hymenobacter armeniacus TaxID=2771358 RepID=A0ABR8JXG7_9BACT|nr:MULTISPECIES: LacI family DNA-binding transcriptional regulator [Hymenobacter]MBD2724656.1 LacI family DNA-binding transcriptional regulator [Hymenobacter armeniacus]MBJ6111079.1 LacI family DNA-binding transcriptional regulator [Hymenobacter sp. BT523]